MKIVDTERDYSKLYSFGFDKDNIVAGYLRKLPEAEAKETYDRLLTFLNEIGSDAAAQWVILVLDRPRAVNVLTDKRTLDNAEFVKMIGADAAWYWFMAIAKTKAVSLLTSDKVLKFATEIGSDAAEKFFYAMAETKAVDVLTNPLILNNAENIAKFVERIGSNVARWWFYTMAKTGAVSLLTSKEVLKFATESYAAGRFFYTMAKTGAVDVLTDPLILNNAEFVERIGSYAAGKWFREIAKTNTKGKKWSDYYLMIFDEMSKKPSQYTELEPLKENILRVAIEKWDGKSRQTQLDRYLLASAMQRLNVDYSKIFGGKLEDAENYCNEVLNTALKEIGVKQPEKLAFNEKLLLLDSKLNRHEIDKLNEAIKVKSEGYVISWQNLSAKEQQTQNGLSLDKAIDYLVLGLNGTKDSKKRNREKEAIDWLKENFPNIADRAIGEWENVKKGKIKELSSAYKEFKENPTQENAEKVFNIFKGKEHEALDNIAVNIEALTKNYIIGNHIIIFEGKSPFMLFDNRELAACAFLPYGAYRSAAFDYLLNRDVILIGISFADKVPENPDMNYIDKEVRKMNAVVICGIAEINGNKVLYVDSLESNSHNWKILKTHYKFIIDSLIKVAEKHGLDGVAVFTRPLNQTPRAFVDLLRLDGWSNTYATDITSKEHKPYFEGRGEIPVLLHLIRK
ncbi:MAG: hypothetical protein QXS81_03820 [Candidatus Micrarchaeaceae archaeon]